MVLERRAVSGIFFFFFSFRFCFFSLFFYIPFYTVTLSLIYCAIFSSSTSSHPSHSPSPPPQPLNHHQPTSPPLIHSPAFSTFPRTLAASQLSIHRLCKIILSSLGRGLGATRGVDVSNVLNLFMHFRGKKLFYQKCVRFYRFALIYFLLPYLNPGFFFFFLFLILVWIFIFLYVFLFERKRACGKERSCWRSRSFFS